MGLKDWLGKFRAKKTEEDDEIFGDGAYKVPFSDENLIIDRMRARLYNEFMRDNKRLYEEDAIKYWKMARYYVDMKIKKSL